MLSKERHYLPILKIDSLKSTVKSTATAILLETHEGCDETEAKAISD